MQEPNLSVRYILLIQCELVRFVYLLLFAIVKFFNYIYGNESKFNWTNIQNESSSGHEADPLAQRKDTMQYMNADIASGSKIETNQVCFQSPNTEIKAKQPEGSGDQNKVTMQ